MIMEKVLLKKKLNNSMRVFIDYSCSFERIVASLFQVDYFPKDTFIYEIVQLYMNGYITFIPTIVPP